MKSPRPISSVIAAHASLDALRRQTERLRALQGILGNRLGGLFQQHARVAALREDGTLVLIARSPVWATKLRYMVPEILNWTRGEAALTEVRTIEVQVGDLTGI
jgi:hypothetical protein